MVKALKKESLSCASQEMDNVSKFRGDSVRVSPDVRSAGELFFLLKLASWEKKGRRNRSSLLFICPGKRRKENGKTPKKN